MNIKQIRKEFPIFQNQKDFVYFDNATTSLKHKLAIEAVNNYMSKSTSNFFDSDFSWSKINNQKLQEARKNVAQFMGCSPKEVIFSYGTSSLLHNVSQIIKSIIKPGDQIIINNHEHSANHMPWLKIAKEKKAKLIIIKLKNNQKLHSIINKYINKKTKVIAFSGATNVTGQKREIAKIAKICRKNNIISVVDGAQYAALNKLECNKWNVDFFIWGPHKVYSPPGIGVMYGKYATLEKFPPVILAGSSTNKCNIDGKMELKPIPYCYEYGTQNIPAIIATGEVCKWINKIDVNKISKHVYSLRKYALRQMEKLDNIEIYNSSVKSTTIVFNFKGIPPQDLVDYLGKNNIALRAGDMCAKLTNFAPNNHSARISFAIYNDKKDVNKFIKLLKNKTPQHIVRKLVSNE